MSTIDPDREIHEATARHLCRLIGESFAEAHKHDALAEQATTENYARERIDSARRQKDLGRRLKERLRVHLASQPSDAEMAPIDDSDKE